MSIEDPSQEDLSNLTELLLTASQESGAMALQELHNQNEFQLFYSICVILSNLEIPSEDPEATTDEIEAIFKISKAGFHISNSIFRENINHPLEQLVDFCINILGTERLQIVKQVFYKGLACCDITIRSTAAELLCTLIAIYTVVKRNQEIYQEINDIYATDSVGIYMKAAILYTYGLIVEKKILTTRYRRYRLFFSDFYSKIAEFLSAEIPDVLKIEPLKAFQYAIKNYFTFLNKKDNEGALQQFFEILLNLIINQSEYNKDFHKELYLSLRLLCKLSFESLNTEIIDNIFETTTNDISTYGEEQSCLQDYIHCWNAIVQSQEDLLRNYSADQKEDYFYLENIVENLTTLLLEAIVQGNYTDINNTDDYQVPIDSLHCLKTLGDCCPEIVLNASTEAYNQQVQLATQTTDNESLLIIAECILQTIIQINSDEQDEFIIEKLADIFELMESGNKNVMLSNINILDHFLTFRVKQHPDAYTKILDEILQHLQPFLLSQDSELAHRAYVAFVSFLNCFSPKSPQNYIADNFEAIWQLIQNFMESPGAQVDDQTRADSFAAASYFFKALPASYRDFLIQVLNQYINTFNELIVTNPLPKELINNIANMLASLIMAIGQGCTDQYDSFIQVVLQFLSTQEEEEESILYLLSSLTYNLGNTAKLYAEPIISLFEKTMSTSSNKDVINASLIALSDLYRVSSPDATILSEKAFPIAVSLINYVKDLDAYISKDPSVLTVIVEALSDVLQKDYVDVNMFDEQRELFISFFKQMQNEVMQISTYDLSTALSLSGAIFLCYRDIVSMHEAESPVLMDMQNRQNTFLYQVKDDFFGFIKMVFELNPHENHTKAYTNMLWCYCQFLRQLVFVAGRPFNLQLNSRWTKGLYENALNIESNDELRNFARSFLRNYQSC